MIKLSIDVLHTFSSTVVYFYTLDNHIWLDQSLSNILPVDEIIALGSPHCRFPIVLDATQNMPLRYSIPRQIRLHIQKPSLMDELRNFTPRQLIVENPVPFQHENLHILVDNDGALHWILCSVIESRKRHHAIVRLSLLA